MKKYTLLLPMLALPLISTHIMANQDKAMTGTPSATVKPTNNNQAQTNPIEIIQNDHAKIRRMLGDLSSKLKEDIQESKKMFKDIKAFLVKHETMEQKIWYPALEEKDADLKNIIADMKKEEEQAGNSIKKIDATSDDKEWADKVEKLISAVKQHAQDEETKLFPKVKEKIDQATLNQIGEKLKKYHTDNKM